MTLYDWGIVVQGQQCIQAFLVKTEQNTIATLNDIVSVRQFVKWEGKYWESPNKPNNKKPDINLVKLVKEESVKDIDSKVSGINTISGERNPFKGITSK